MLGSNLSFNSADRNAANSLQAALAQAGYTSSGNELAANLRMRASEQNVGNDLQRYIQNANFDFNTQDRNVSNELQRLQANAQYVQDTNVYNATNQQQANIANITNRLQAAGMLPATLQAEFDNIANLSAAGSEEQAYNQAVIDANIQKKEFDEMEPYMRDQIYSNALAGSFGGTSVGSAKSGK